mgnify:CR=1 FL=1
MKKFVVESVNTFYEIHIVEAEDEEQANMIAFGQAALTLLIECLENSK